VTLCIILAIKFDQWNPLLCVKDIGRNSSWMNQYKNLKCHTVMSIAHIPAPSCFNKRLTKIFVKYVHTIKRPPLNV